MVSFMRKAMRIRWHWVVALTAPISLFVAGWVAIVDQDPLAAAQPLVLTLLLLGVAVLIARSMKLQRQQYRLIGTLNKSIRTFTESSSEIRQMMGGLRVSHESFGAAQQESVGSVGETVQRLEEAVRQQSRQTSWTNEFAAQRSLLREIPRGVGAGNAISRESHDTALNGRETITALADTVDLLKESLDDLKRQPIFAATPQTQTAAAEQQATLLKRLTTLRLDGDLRHSELQLLVHQLRNEQADVLSLGQQILRDSQQLADQLGDLRRQEGRRADLAADLREGHQKISADQDDLVSVVNGIAQLLADTGGKDGPTAPGVRLAQLNRHGEWALSEASAMHNLFALLPVRSAMPPMGEYAVTPRTLLSLVGHVLARRGGTIIECGSGTSTVWLALACRTVGAGRVISLEHDPNYARQTRGQLASAGLEEWADVRDAPLRDVNIGDETYCWYSPSVCHGLPPADLVLVDGPPKATGPQARFPALAMLADVLQDGTIIALDDTNRSEEKATLERWLHDPIGSIRLERLAVEGRTTLMVVRRALREDS